MALRVRIYQVTWQKETSVWNVYTGMYDDNAPATDVARKVFSYSTVYTETQVENAVRNGYRASAKAYIKRNEIKTSLEAMLADVMVPTS